jgi:hypothetical protein
MIDRRRAAAAYAIRLEKEIGSITPGKKAGFVVLEQDPLTIDARKLKDIKVWGTVFEGRVMPVAAPVARLPFAPRTTTPAASPSGTASIDDGWREAIATAGLFCGCCVARMPMRRA